MDCNKEQSNLKTHIYDLSVLRIENLDGLSEEDQFKMLSDDMESENVVLLIHGGGFMCHLELVSINV